jgi:threonine dehydrogenase-like Zn-dependent dehydrogenase
MANLAPVPDDLTDERVLMCPDIMSTGFGGAESGRIRIGDTVAVFAQGPIGLCATAGAKLSGATTVIGVDALPERLDRARRLGADHVIDFRKTDPVEEIMRITDGRGVDVAIEALGTQTTFESCLRVLRPGGTLSSLGVYSSDLKIPLSAFAAGLGDHKIVTTLCPGGKERMRRLMRSLPRTVSISSRWSPIDSSWTRSKRPMNSSATSATACSKSRSHPSMRPRALPISSAPQEHESGLAAPDLLNFPFSTLCRSP